MDADKDCAGSDNQMATNYALGGVGGGVKGDGAP